MWTWDVLGAFFVRFFGWLRLYSSIRLGLETQTQPGGDFAKSARRFIPCRFIPCPPLTAAQLSAAPLSERRARDRVRFECLADTGDCARRVAEPHVVSVLLTVVLRVETVGSDAHRVRHSLDPRAPRRLVLAERRRVTEGIDRLRRGGKAAHRPRVLQRQRGTFAGGAQRVGGVTEEGDARRGARPWL
eukprot:scaffold13145_cov69-Phaeocystis_antarctica.AAC.6